MLWAILALVGLVLGIALLAYSGDKAVEHSVSIALEWGLSPLIIGLVLVSLGTDLPEIINSIMSSALGHGDINVGDSLGSVLTQMTLVLGLLPFLVGKFKVKRKEVAIIGACEILALMLAVSIAEKGYISRINGLFLVASWPIFMLLTRSATAKKSTKKEKKQIVTPTNEKHLHHIWRAFLGFVGVAVGAFIVIESVITLSTFFQISEYLISFFVVAIGTSLPELVVELAAIRKGQYEIAIGDAIGSCVVDASFSIGIGPLIFGNPPIAVSGGLVMTTGLYAIFGSILVVSTLALRERIDKIVGVFFIFLYLLSYATPFA
ncbi:MAG: sodium:calcium antiporter [Candidatus Bathyarchaeota archaeon]|nr:MAG: sodium:calcium antiporter [Candidatus Bathyarchaeota archaeon]